MIPYFSGWIGRLLDTELARPLVARYEGAENVNQRTIWASKEFICCGQFHDCPSPPADMCLEEVRIDFSSLAPHLDQFSPRDQPQRDSVEVVSIAQEMDSAAAEESSETLKCTEDAQLAAVVELLSHLRLMVNDPFFSDVSFVCKDGKVVQASRILLAGRSPVLKSMLMNGMAESRLSKIVLPEVSSAVLLSVFEFIYAGTLVDHRLGSWSMACELINASRFFQLPKLETLTRKFMQTQVSAVAQDLPKAAHLMTEAFSFKALYDESDPIVEELVTILSSNWSDPIFVRSLCEDAFRCLLAHSSNCEEDDDDKLSFKEYLRFRQVIRWWVYQSDFGCYSTEELVDFIAPDEKRALALCRNPEKFERPGCPPEDNIRLITDWDCFREHKASRNSAVGLLAHIDWRWIHPVLITNVVEPLKVISAAELLNAFRFHAIRRPMIFKMLTCEWEHGESYSTLENGFVIQKTGDGYGLAIMKAGMARSFYQWCFILERGCLSSVEMGFLHRANGVNKPALDGEGLVVQPQARVLLMHGQEVSANWKDGGGWFDWKVLLTSFNKLKNVKALFTFNALDHTCSLALNDHYLGVVWKDLPNEIFYPAISFGGSCGGRVRIELSSGFDII